MSRSLVRLRLWLVRSAFAVARRLPLQRRVVLATAHADRLSGNLAAIRDDLERRGLGTRLTVLAYRSSGDLRGKAAAIWHAIRSAYHLATARLVVVDDYFFPMYAIRPRQGTQRVQVWHACGAFKRFGYSVLDRSFGADEAYVSQVPIHANYDLCLVSSSSVAPHYAEAFGLPLARFDASLGIPRTDFFFDAGRQAAAADAVRRRYRLDDTRRTVLYAPTFRGESVTRADYADVLDLRALHAALGADHRLLLRLHPFVRRRQVIAPELSDFVVDVSDAAEINELMLVSDVLVTDYSSAIYEFALLGRPIAFLAPDHEAYERERGFYFDFRTGVPGPIFESTADLAAYLRAGDFDLGRVVDFAARSFDVADGRATARFIDRVVLPALAGRAIGPADREPDA
jgi:CDP-ribitol ribitolphosphotransferase